MSHTPIVPALIPRSQTEVKTTAEQLAFAREFHLDIVDGQFVTPASWPYQPAGDPMAVKSALDCYTLEVDLMVEKPVTAAKAWLAAGADMLVFHVETITPEAFKNFTQQTEVSVGISYNGQTTMDTVAAYLPAADYIQLMGIYTIGAQGQPLDEAVFEKIAHCKKHYPHLPITIDGSVNKETIERLQSAGADRFIVGSAITLQEDPLAAYQELNVLIND